ncbi:hypothetical protein PVAP13_3KG540301 [Panicum virgatum]|uniref:Uncharacterized protein n=1 Tax=Panicum virgatum TaxID=38727 RepID=A0A8T0V1T3_PANVG|nr:hypothetical protein PVAP13_3KG540301 [Panicum virgatum]
MRNRSCRPLCNQLSVAVSQPAHAADQLRSQVDRSAADDIAAGPGPGSGAASVHTLLRRHPESPGCIQATGRPCSSLRLHLPSGRPLVRSRVCPLQSQNAIPLFDFLELAIR